MAKQRRSWLRKWLFRSVLIGLGLVGLLFLLVYVGAFGKIPSQEELLDFEHYTATEVLSEEGKLIGKIYVEDRSDLKLDEVPSYVAHALVATEDARYYEHEGLDSRSLLRVLVKSILLNQDAGGGSTISQQLVKNMYGRDDHGIFSTPVAKMREIIIARRLEKVLDKDQILILYLNQVPFGENVYGIQSASQRFFNKDATELKLEEAAVLIGMLKANTAYNPRLYPERSLARRNVVLSQMEHYNYLSAAQKDSFQNLPLDLDYANMNTKGPANYFLVHVQDEAQKILEKVNAEQGSSYDLKTDGLKIKTTLNYSAQVAGISAMEQHLKEMQKALRQHYFKWNKKGLSSVVDAELKRLGFENRADEKRVQDVFDWEGFYTDTLSVRDSLGMALTLLHAGIFGLDPNTGAIRTWVGGIDQRTQPYDQIFAKRQMASSFKPILYAAALEDGVEPCIRLENDSMVLVDGNKAWRPENYDHSYGGTYSLKGALTESMNVPTVNLYFETGFAQLAKLWKDLGFTSKLKDRPVTALGPTDASLYEATIAYAAFANGGYRVSPYMIESISTSGGEVIYSAKPSKKVQVMSARTANMMNVMLKSVIDHGTGRRMKSYFGGNLAGKTGTSQNYADAWFIAYNPKIVMASRVGASTPRIHFSTGMGSGSTLALPLVGITMAKGGSKWRSDFIPLEEGWQDAMDCPDFLEDSMLQEWLDQLKDDETTTDEEERKANRRKKIRNFIENVFGKKE